MVLDVARAFCNRISNRFSYNYWHRLNVILSHQIFLFSDLFPFYSSRVYVYISVKVRFDATEKSSFFIEEKLHKQNIFVPVTHGHYTHTITFKGVDRM